MATRHTTRKRDLPYNQRAARHKPTPAARRTSASDGAGAAWSWPALARAVGLDVLNQIDAEIGERLRRIPTQLNRYGYDPWGFNVDAVRRSLVLMTLMYRYYFRVATDGVDRLPRGRVLVIGNHAGQVAIDAAMITAATFLEGDPPRILRGMGEYWLPTVPFISTLMTRTGSVVGTPKNCIDLLNQDEAVIAFPEGVRGMNKLYSQRYRLQRFGDGFMRLALATRTPIVPVAVVGSEEQAPGLANLRSVADLLGMPAFPLTLTWPWLGPLGLIPLPVKYRIYFGEPMHFDGDPDEEDAVIRKRVEKVKGAIRTMLAQGLRQRRSIFW